MEIFKRHHKAILVSLLTICLTYSWYFWIRPQRQLSESQSITNKDTVKIINKSDTMPPKKDDVSGKRVLFIGDSHTCYNKGWQYQVATAANMSFQVVAKRGEKTDWMLKNSKDHFSEKFDYCIIWGGANDAASYYPMDSTLANLQRMINLGKTNGTKMIVLTGFNPNVIKITENNKQQWGFYPGRYRILQERMINELKGALIVQNWFVSRDFGDCDDFICHMTASGHRKMANGIINALNFKTHI